MNTFLKKFQSQNNVVITKYNLDENIIKAGNNFCAVLMRLTIEYPQDGVQRRKSVLLKIPSLSQDFQELLRTDIYDREIYAYEVFLPKMYELGARPNYSPTFYAAMESKAVVMEDLTESGYKMLDKKIPLDLEHCRVALKIIARHHAVSVIFLKTHRDSRTNELMENVGLKMNLEKYLHVLYDPFLSLISPWITDSLREKLQEHRNHFVATALMACTTHPDGLNVVVHGDYWKNNILYSYDDDGSVTGAKVIDWQATRIGSPVVELIYFFVSSVPCDLFKMHKEEFYGLYLDTLNETWSKLKFDCEFTKDEFEQQLNKYKRVFVNILPGFVFLILADETQLYGEVRNTASLTPEHISLALTWLDYIESEKILE